MSPAWTTTAPVACLASLPVSNEISLARDLHGDARNGVRHHMYSFLSPPVGRRSASRVFSVSERVDRSDPLQITCRRHTGAHLAVHEQRRRRHHPGADAALEVALHPRGHRLASGGRRRSARRRARALARAPTGAGPRAAPGRRTARRASPRSAPWSAGRLGRARGRPRARVLRAHREVAEAPARAGRREPRVQRARSTGTRSRRRRSPAARRPRRARGRRARAAGAARCRGRSGRSAAAASASKIRFAPGSSPGRSRLVAPLHDAVGADRSPARAAGSRPARGRRRTLGTPRPWARSPTAARS